MLSMLKLLNGNLLNPRVTLPMLEEVTLLLWLQINLNLWFMEVGVSLLNFQIWWSTIWKKILGMIPKFPTNNLNGISLLF
jgi:hypothetical protein